MRTLFGFLLALLIGSTAFATHLIGGYIRTSSVSGQANAQQITVTMYYNLLEGANAANAAQTLSLCLGDGNTVMISRTSSQTMTSNGIAAALSIDQYTTTHAYSGPGVYQLGVVALSRNENIRNINDGQSVNKSFAVRTTVQVGLANQTPVLTWPSTGLIVALNQPVALPIAATDADGDSLSYGLALPLSNLEPDAAPAKFCASFSAVKGYQFPNDVQRVGTYRLNPRTGQLNWNVPVEQGRYSVAIVVSEWRAGALISQTQQEITLLVVDRGGTAVTPPAYEPTQLTTITAVAIDHAGLQVSVSPNPVANGLLHVELVTAFPKPATLELVDSQGRVYRSVELKQPVETRRHTFDVSNVPAGLYLIRAESNGQQVVRKVVKP